MPQDSMQTPKVDGFRIKMKLKGSFADVAKALRSISFLKIAQERECVNAAYVESRSIDKTPYLFSLMKFRKAEVEVIYTIPNTIAPTKRKLDIIRYLLNMLSLLEPYYDIDSKVVYQLLEETMRQLDDYANADYKKLYKDYDDLKREVENLRRSVMLYKNQVRSLSKENYEMKGQTDEMKLRVERLQGGISEGTLITRIQEWIADHNGSINISDFCKHNMVPEVRVEEALDKLVKEGYLEQLQ